MRKGQVLVKGFALLMAAFLLMLVLFVTIEPLKENLDVARGGTGLNCPGVSDFNQTAYDLQDSHERLQKRTTCFVTGISMVWFVGAFLIALSIWLARNWK